MLISHASKVKLKILQARLQQYLNWGIPDVQARFRKGRRTRDQIANIPWITEKARKFQKNVYLCFIDHDRAFDCVDQNKLWKILKEVGIPDYLTCLLKNLYADKKTQLEPDMEQWTGSNLGKEYVKAVYCHPAENIMQNAALDESQVGIKIPGRNNDNLKYANDTTLKAESEEELKRLFNL